jgi:16S rRNA (uracil1498-N3)-methyltransferase
MKEGDAFILFDGSGTDYPCRVESIADGELIAAVGQGIPGGREPAASITLYLAMLKKDKMDWALQKATELGVARFVPILTARCVRRPDDKQKLAARFEKTAKEAAKQSGRSSIPEIGELTDIFDLEKQIKKHGAMLFAYEKEDVSIKKRLAGRREGDIGIIIGPEGGFEPTEAAALEKAGATPCGLGKLILRAETAAVAAVSMILYEKME